MPEFKDWTDYKARHPEQFAKPGRTPQTPEALGDLTTKARTIVASPAWQMFLDRLASKQALLRQAKERLQNDMVNGPAMGHELDLLKLSIQALQGEEAGLQFAMEIVPAMLEAGEQMLKELTATPTESAAR